MSGKKYLDIIVILINLSPLLIVLISAIIGYFFPSKYYNSTEDRYVGFTKNYNDTELEVSFIIENYKTEESYVRKYLQPEYLNQIDQKLVNQLKAPTLKDTIWNIILWEDLNIEYDYSKAYREDVKIQSSLETLKRKKGVCIDYAILTASLILRCGYQPVYIFVIKTAFHEHDHAFASVKINGKFYVLDQHPPIEELNQSLCEFEKEHDTIITHVYYYKLWIKNNKTYTVKYEYNWNNSVCHKLKLKQKREYKIMEKVIMQKIIKKYKNLKIDPKFPSEMCTNSLKRLKKSLIDMDINDNIRRNK